MKRVFAKKYESVSLGIPVNLNTSDSTDSLSTVLRESCGMTKVGQGDCLVVVRDDYSILNLANLENFMEDERIILYPDINGLWNSQIIGYDFLFQESLVEEIIEETRNRGAFCNDFIAKRGLFHKLFSLTLSTTVRGLFNKFITIIKS